MSLLLRNGDGEVVEQRAHTFEGEDEGVPWGIDLAAPTVTHADSVYYLTVSVIAGGSSGTFRVTGILTQETYGDIDNWSLIEGTIEPGDCPEDHGDPTDPPPEPPPGFDPDPPLLSLSEPDGDPGDTPVRTETRMPPTAHVEYAFEAPEAGAYRLHIRADGQMPLATVINARSESLPTVHASDVSQSVTLVASAAGERFTIALESTGPDLAQVALEVNPERGYVEGQTERTDENPRPYRLYYPEGFASPTIEEFVPIVNPNAFDVRYELIARYEFGKRDQVLAEGTIAPNSRGGVTLSSRRNPELTRPRQGVPYALELRADGALGATLSHYDFGVTTGEAFTTALATQWTFASVERDAGNRDFLVLYNPNDRPTDYTITLLDEHGATTSFTRTVEAYRRAGVSIGTDDAIQQDGRFGLSVESDLPIIAALSSYDTDGGHGFGTLGTLGSGTTRAVLPDIDPTQNGTITLLNRSDRDAQVYLFGTHNASGKEVRFELALDAGTRREIRVADLPGMRDGPHTLRTQSHQAVTVQTSTVRHGDADATTPRAWTTTAVLYADAFINRDARALYQETLHLHNPGEQINQIRVSLLFPDGRRSTELWTLEPGQNESIRLDTRPELIRDPAFSLLVESELPFVSSFSHYDFFLEGGWQTTGTVLGGLGVLLPAEPRIDDYIIL